MRIASAAELALRFVVIAAVAGRAQGGVGAQVGKLVAPDAAELDYFGRSVALSGDTLVIGARLDDHAGGIDAGSAHVFVLGEGGWTWEATLTASDAADDDQFGFSVGISGDTVVVGAASDDHAGGIDAGSAYVFVRSGTSWAEQARLTASDAADGDSLGAAIAIDGDTVVVGSYRDDTQVGVENSGSACVFVRSGTTWTQQAKLAASDGGQDEGFGLALALSQDTALIGALFHDLPGKVDAGSAYVFVRSGTAWTQQTRLTAGSAKAGDNFGIAVALAGNTAIVGADEADDHIGGVDAGAAFVFVRSGTTWAQQARLTAVDEDLPPAANFGRSVAAWQDTAVVGTYGYDHAVGLDEGAAYVYLRSGTTWSERGDLVPTDGALGDDFGISVALDGSTIVVGAVSDDSEAATHTGSAVVFTLNGFSDGGGGLPGIEGIPRLEGTGLLVAGTSGSLAFTAGGTPTTTMLLVSLADLPLAFKGGVVHTVPYLLGLVLATSPLGSWTLPWMSWPAGIAPGTTLSFECLVVDPAAPQGVAISNLLHATQP